jgi:hypothetical protein
MFPSGLSLFRFIDSAHLSATEFLDDAVVGNRAVEEAEGSS